MTPRYPTSKMNSLFDAVLSMKTQAELANFFRDVMTIKEIKEISKRWQIAQLLDQGIPYLQISEQVDVSTTTVTRVAHWLNQGKNGYRTALSRLKK